MKVSRAVRLIVWIILISVAVYLRFFHGIDQHDRQDHIALTLLSLCILLLSFKIIIDGLVIWYRIGKESHKGLLRDNLITGFSNLFSIFSVVAILLGLLSIFGLNFKEVFTSLSFIAAAIAIISKDFIVDIIIGLSNGFSRKIELNDYVRVGTQRGKILDIGLQKITLLNDDDDIVFIPNLQFNNSQIINYTKRALRRINIDFQLHHKFLLSVDDLEQKLIEVCTHWPDDIEQSSFNLKIVSIVQEAIEFKFQYNLNHLDRELQLSIRKAILRRVAEYIADNRDLFMQNQSPN